MRAIAPGKLILSGEHAVVYGKPAIAMAVDRCAEAIILPAGEPEAVTFDLQDLKCVESFTVRALRDFKKRVLKNYRMFLDGQLSIREVLHKPIELFQYAYITILDALHVSLTSGVLIRLHSNIPIGCGMGSSAATVLSVLRSIGHYFRVEFRPEWYQAYSLEAENLQHGRASGVDTYISLHGGCAVFRQGEARSLPLPRLPMHLVNTGTPATTTGECVSYVRERHGNSTIWDEFEKTTARMEKALTTGDTRAVQQCVRENHRLLEQIGVVPARVSEFVSEVESRGGAAKVCGAGAVAGDAAGIVMVCSPEPPRDLCKKYGYELISVRGEPLGARIV